jgi:hypothetical protein
LEQVLPHVRFRVTPVEVGQPHELFDVAVTVRRVALAAAVLIPLVFTP